MKVRRSTDGVSVLSWAFGQRAVFTTFARALFSSPLFASRTRWANGEAKQRQTTNGSGKREEIITKTSRQQSKRGRTERKRGFLQRKIRTLACVCTMNRHVMSLREEHLFLSYTSPPSVEEKALSVVRLATHSSLENNERQYVSLVKRYIS